MATPLSADRLLAALRAEGLTVREHTGWRTHNRDAATGKVFGPVYGVLIHHTAGHDDKELCYNGRSDLPGPLCHSWLGKTAGLWMLGNGRANHAGLVDGDVIHALVAESSPLPHDDRADTDGNDCLYGLEIENLGNGRDPYPPAQYDQAVRWATAICRAHGWSEKSVAGHKEVQPGKVDPSFDMDVFRAAVAARLAHSPDWNPNEEDDVADLTTDNVKQIFGTDGAVPAARPPVANDDYTDGNTSWSAGYALQTAVEGVRKAQQQIGAVAADVDAIKTKVDTLTVGGVDLDALADKVADKLAARLAE